MKHFSFEEWKAFYHKEGSFNEEEMENHLLECDVCNKLFLENIDEDMIQELEVFIPPEFTTSTLRYIERKSLPKRSRPKTIRNRLLASYAVAASLTLMLMGGGVFENYSGEINRISKIQNSALPLQVASFLNNWTTQVKLSTWDWIEKIPLEEGWEVKK